MTLNKLTTDIQPLTEVDKINEIIDSVNSITIPSVGNGTVSFTQNGHQKGSFSANQNSNTTIDFDLSSRNIGEIVTSTIPLTDAGLHLLDGALIQGSGVYSAFVTYIAGLVSTYPDLFTTEANWQNAITQYGVCGKFVYNSTNNTVRLPKYSNKIFTGEGTAPVIGNGKTLGFTNGTQNGGMFCRGNYQNNELFSTNYFNVDVGSHQTYGDFFATDESAIGVTSDPSKSGLIAQLSDIRTSLDGYYYIVVATSTKTDIQVDIDEIATDLNGKADTDLSNVPVSKGILTESYVNGTSWYRVYSDGWCEQGGKTGTRSGDGYLDVTFLKPFSNTNYSVQQSLTGASVNSSESLSIVNLTTTGCRLYMWNNRASFWQANGYIN